MNLYRFVQTMGLQPLVCGNIKGMLDLYRTPETQKGFAAQWGQTPEMVTSFADGTKISFEQAIVANATGMCVAERGMSGPEYRDQIDGLVDFYDVDRLKALGGVVDYALGATPSPGVYVFAAHDDPRHHIYLDYAKLGKGPLYSFYTPITSTISRFRSRSRGSRCSATRCWRRMGRSGSRSSRRPSAT
jgi:predicted homoserine dehydrogenase-like protein